MLPMTQTGPRTLGQVTTLRIGGSVRAWVDAESEAHIEDAARTPGRLVVLGGGSNLVAPDEAIDATVVRIATRGVAVRVSGEAVHLDVMAGEPWDDLVAMCVHEGWTGIEAMSGIPGLVGATPVQNVGAYGQEVSDVVASVRALDRSTGEIVSLDPRQCGFAYRHSRFKAEPDRWIVLSVGLVLRARRECQVAYAELASLLGVEVGANADIAEVRAAVLLLRKRKGMVLDPDDHDTWSAGSFFTNPILSPVEAGRIDLTCPRYPTAVGVKVSAAWLIEQAGITKGFGLPGSRAAVSGKHVLALTNRGGATSAEVMDLAGHVQHEVQQTFGVSLVPEPVILHPSEKGY